MRIALLCLLMLVASTTIAQPEPALAFRPTVPCQPVLICDDSGRCYISSTCR